MQFAKEEIHGVYFSPNIQKLFINLLNCAAHTVWFLTQYTVWKVGEQLGTRITTY